MHKNKRRDNWNHERKMKNLAEISTLPGGLVDSYNFLAILKEEANHQQIVYGLHLLGQRMKYIGFYSFEVIGEVVSELMQEVKLGNLDFDNQLKSAIDDFLRYIYNMELCVSTKEEKEMAVHLMDKFAYLKPTDASLLAIASKRRLIFFTVDKFDEHIGELESELNIKIVDIRTIIS